MAKTVAKKIPQPEQSQLDFETALARLEEIVERLDDGNVPLAQSLALFKEGTVLAKRCRDLLGAAELAVKEALADVNEDELDDFNDEEADDEASLEDDDGA